MHTFKKAILINFEPVTARVKVLVQFDEEWRRLNLPELVQEEIKSGKLVPVVLSLKLQVEDTSVWECRDGVVIRPDQDLKKLEEFVDYLGLLDHATLRLQRIIK